MMALSIRQPWAWMILNGGKRVENRGWATAYRGRFLIHASRTRATQLEYQHAIDMLNASHPDPASLIVPFLQDMPCGGIVGEAELVDCVTTPPDNQREWFMGTYGFVLANVRHLPFRPCRGQLGLFSVEREVA